MKKLLGLLFFFISLPLWAQAPHVVVSIQPIHSLTASLMKGIGEPYLLLPPDNSPHFFQLRPRDAQLIHKADLMIWVGPQLEHFLEKPYEALNPNALKVTLIDQEGLILLGATHSHDGPHQLHDHDDHHDHDQHHESNSHHEHEAHPLKPTTYMNYDPHIWLSPENAKIIIKAIEEALIKSDPLHQDQYQANSQALMAQIDTLKGQMKETLKGMENVPFLVFHDGYQYYNHSFGLNQAGYMTDNPHVPLSLHRIQELKKTIQEKQVACIFSEPGTNKKILDQIAKNTLAQVGELDPLGMTLTPGPDAYSTMMHNLANDTKACLETALQQNAEEPKTS